jgi:hypothetical protein
MKKTFTREQKTTIVYGILYMLFLGAVRQATGSFTPGFVLLALFAILCSVVVFKSGSKTAAKTHFVSHGAAA